MPGALSVTEDRRWWVHDRRWWVHDPTSDLGWVEPPWEASACSFRSSFGKAFQPWLLVYPSLPLPPASWAHLTPTGSPAPNLQLDSALEELPVRQVFLHRMARLPETSRHLCC